MQEDSANGSALWTKPETDAWLAANGCTRRTCLVVTRYVDADADVDEPPLAPDAYLWLSDFPAVTNLVRADVRVADVQLVDQRTVQVSSAAVTGFRRRFCRQCFVSSAHRCG